MIPATSHDVWACKLTLDSALVDYQIKTRYNVIYGQHTMHCHNTQLASMIGLQVIVLRGNYHTNIFHKIHSYTWGTV